MVIDANISSRINLMRILLISGIVFVHVPYDPHTSPFLGDNGFIDWIRVFLGDSLFRVGVPCLSAISGYLLFRHGLDAFDYGKTIRSKARTVLLPFLIWSVSFLVLVIIAQRQGLGFGYLPDAANATPRELVTLAFAIESLPINVPLYFLRDLLLCILLTPVLGLLISRYPLATLTVFFLYAVFPFPSGIFLKKSILFGFSCGIYASLHKVDIRMLDPYAEKIAILFLAAAVLLATGLYWTGPEFPVWLDILRSLTAICGIIGSWAISAVLIRSRFGMRLSKLEGLSFWIFCAHYPLLIAFWMVWNRTAHPGLYPIFYFATPILALIILVASHNVTKRMTPRLHAVLTGSRAGSGSGSPPTKPGKDGTSPEGLVRHTFLKGKSDTMTKTISAPFAALAVLVAILPASAVAQDGNAGISFVENFDKIDRKVWYVSDGWDNGAHQNCTWSKKQVSVQNGVLELTFEQRKAGKRDYACGEIQTRKRFGYGTYEARIKTAEGSGLNSAFFTYIGPTDKKPHDEIDFEVLGKDSGKVQVNQYISAKGGNEKLVDVAGGANEAFNDYAFIWEKDRLRYYVNGILVQEITDPAKIPVNNQKIFFSLWGTDTLSDWMGKFDYQGPAKMQVDRVAFTAPGEKCKFPESITCALN